jgi:hypothetical protein
MTCFFFGSGFWLSKIWETSMPFSFSYPDLHKSLIGGRWKRRHHIALVRNSNNTEWYERTIWGAKLYLILKVNKTQDYKQGRLRDLKFKPFQASIIIISLVDTHKVHRYRKSLQ